MKEPLTRKSISENVKMTALSRKPNQVNEPKMVSRVTCDRQPATSKHTNTGILTDVIIMEGGKTLSIDEKLHTA